MTDLGLKNMLGFVLRYKKLAGALLERFDAGEVERGIISISQDIINRDLKMFIMEKFAENLNDYLILFDNSAIFIDLDLNIKQLGRIKAKYMLVIDEFLFHEQCHKIKFTYREDVKSEGNFVQNMAIKAAGLKGTYLQTAVDISNLDFIEADKESFTIGIDKIDVNKKIPPSLNLVYTSSENEILKLHFNI